MVVAIREASRNRICQNLIIGECGFEVVKEFSYLETNVNFIWITVRLRDRSLDSGAFRESVLDELNIMWV